MIKSGELMLGNLVKTKLDKVIQINAIHLKKIGYHNRKDKLTWSRLDSIFPIPLTPEILRANGFLDSPSYDSPMSFTFLYSTSDYLIQCIFKENGLIDISAWDKDKKAQSRIWIIKYVHEFQNILNICKIKKEIILC